MKIVCGTNFSGDARAGLNVAAALAARTHSELILVHVIQSGPLGFPEGYPYDALCVRAQEKLAASHGRSVQVKKTNQMPMKKHLKTKQSVGTTRGSNRSSQSRKGSNGSEVKFRSILVPTDFSSQSLTALNVAKRLADQFDASITLVHVLDPIHAPGRYDSAKLRPLRAEALRDARQKLADLANDHDDLPHEVISGVIHTAIVKFAKKIDADLIVMSSHGRSGVKRLLAGSATENVVRTARCPVLVVP